MSRKALQKNLAYDDKRKVYYVTTYEGGRHTRTYPTYEEALTALYPGVSRWGAAPGNIPSRETATVAEWLNWWLSAEVTPKRAASTSYCYRGIARCHLMSALGHIPLRELTAVRFQLYLYDKQGEGLSSNTALKHYTMMYTALEMAVRMEYLEKNPLTGVIPPQRVDPEHCFYTPAQMRMLFRAAEGSPIELAIQLAAYLGLRRSEITGLRWKCVDLGGRVIYIQEVRTEVGGEIVVKAPKTKRSVRKLGIGGTPQLYQALLRAWDRRRSDDPEEYVLLLPDGTPPDPNRLSQWMRQLVEKNRLPKITLHGLRHSFASIANSRNIPMHDISRTLGHSSIVVTSNVYTHLFDETESATVQTVAEAINDA